MSPEEHELIATMLAKQFQFTELLVRILQSRGIIEGGDLSAVLASHYADREHNSFLLQSMKGEYKKAAKDIGIKVDFPKEKRKRKSKELSLA